MERKMKDSGIPWIGAIPEHWEVMRLRRVFSEAHEKTTDEGGQLLTLSQYTGISPKTEGKRVGMFEAESTVGYNIVHAGQFVMNIMLAWNGSYGVSDFDGIISPAYVVFNFNFRCCKKYFHYLLRLDGYPPAFKTVSRGIIESRLRLYPIYFYQFLTIVPPLAEQERIASYLDEKCGEIDELIDVEQQMISNLESYRQAVITEAVTHGLNPDVPVKETTSFWLPKIPAHWELHYLRGISKGFRKGNGITKEDLIPDGNIACVRYGDLYTKYNHHISDIHCRTNVSKIQNPVYAAYGDIYFTCSGEDVDAIGKSAAYLSDEDCLIGGDLIIMKHSQNPKFLGYSLDSIISQKQKSYGKSKLKVVHTSVKDLKNVAVAIPPLSEQKKIAEYLDAKCSEIDELIKVKQEKIETLKQYRQSLIFEAVTGKTLITNNA
ncbi:restriction endonuclease subunit S [uncultured Duncaniella sp.]|uniref:restriction endonuclease subunit S n=1 Tax=uncultured Duncaniella sp. TaxID=2768039 RepID=UPI0025B73031|nr:restriction endonuclease subunit S [uncultured Duncaniella sp.]